MKKQVSSGRDRFEAALGKSPSGVAGNWGPCERPQKKLSEMLRMFGYSARQLDMGRWEDRGVGNAVVPPPFR